MKSISSNHRHRESLHTIKQKRQLSLRGLNLNWNKTEGSMKFTETYTFNNLQQGKSILNFFFLYQRVGKDARTVLSQHIKQTFLEISRLNQADLSSGHKYAFDVLTWNLSFYNLFLAHIVYFSLQSSSCRSFWNLNKLQLNKWNNWI